MYSSSVFETGFLWPKAWTLLKLTITLKSWSSWLHLLHTVNHHSCSGGLVQQWLLPLTGPYFKSHFATICKWMTAWNSWETFVESKMLSYRIWQIGMYKRHDRVLPRWNNTRDMTQYSGCKMHRERFVPLSYREQISSLENSSGIW